MVFCIFGPMVIFAILWFSKYSVLWIRSTRPARLAIHSSQTRNQKEQSDRLRISIFNRGASRVMWSSALYQVEEKDCPKFETVHHHLSYFLFRWLNCGIRRSRIDVIGSTSQVRIRRDGQARPARQSKDAGVRCRTINTNERKERIGLSRKRLNGQRQLWRDMLWRKCLNVLFTVKTQPQSIINWYE